MAAMGDDREEDSSHLREKLDRSETVMRLQSQVEFLSKRLKELERENEILLSRMSDCPRCSKHSTFHAGEIVLPAKSFNSVHAVTSINNLVKDEFATAKNMSGQPAKCTGNELVEGLPGCYLRTLDNCPKNYIALKIMYYGQRFYGFASEAQMDPTVESELFKAFEKTRLLVCNKENLCYSRCGRTDKGVSSTGQVISLYVRSKLKGTDDGMKKEKIILKEICEEEIDYVRVLNRVLPDDIRVIGWCPVSTDFHARFSCLSREYKYFFWRGTLDIVAMQTAGKKFIGEHDFRNFCRMDAANVNNFRRLITSFEVFSCNKRCEDDELWAVTIRGSAFLWHQVRCMVAVLFMIGQGLESSSVVDLLLDISRTPRKPQYTMAPELPLILRSCEFEDISFICSPDAQRALNQDLNTSLRTYLLQASIFQEALDCLSVQGGSVLEQSHNRRGHVPLMMRPTEPSYEERRAKLKVKSTRGAC